jgi:general secretion pathway protein D
VLETTKRTKYGFYVVAIGIAVLVAVAGPAAVAQNWGGSPIGTTGDSSEVRRQCDVLLTRARACLENNDLSGAEMSIAQAEQLNPSYSFVHTGDTPEKVREALNARKAAAVQLNEPFAERDAMSQPAPTAMPAGPSPKQQSDDLLLQARRELASGRPVEAEAFVRRASLLQLSYSQNDDTPSLLMRQIAAYRDLLARQQAEGALPSYRQEYCHMLVDQAKALAWRGDHQAALYIANQAVRMQVPVVEASKDPQALIATIQRSLVSQGEATQASYTPPTDSSRIQVAQATMPEIPIAAPAPVMHAPASVAQGPNAYDLYNQGLRALEVQDRSTALNYFQQANSYSSQLDPTTRRQLQDKLQMLSSPTTPSVAQRPSLIDGAAVTQSALIDQYRAEVNSKLSQVDQMLEVAPTRAFDAIGMLEETKASIMAAEFDRQSQDMLIQRLDIKIEQCRSTADLYASDIALEEENQQVYAELDAERAGIIDMQEELKQLVMEYNQLMEEQRYAEAVEVGKRARAIAPDEPVAEQLFRTAQMVYRSSIYESIRDQRDDRTVGAVNDIFRSAMPWTGDENVLYGDNWGDIRDRRGMTENISDASSAQDADIRRQLKGVSVLLDYQQPTPLSQVIYDLMQQANINMRLDEEGLRLANLNSSDTITAQLISELTLENALKHILEPKGLTYCVRNGVCVITTPELARGPMVTKPYYVGDLVIPIPNFMPNPNMGLASALQTAYQTAGGFRNGGILAQTFGMPQQVVAATPSGESGQRARIDPFTLNQMGGNSMTNPPMNAGGGSRPSTGSQGGGTQADFGAIIDLITETVEPESWDDWGGPGSISEFEGNLSLVIRQTEDVHNEIAELLQQLRKMQDLQITIEVRFITLNDNYFERIGLDFDFDIDSGIADNILVGGGTGQTDPNDNTTTGVTTPELTTQGGESISVGMSAPGVFSTDLDIPFQQNSFGLAVPQFGNYDITAGAQLGFAILSDIEAFFFIAAAQGDTKSNVLQAPKVTLFNGQMATVADQSQTPFVTGSIPVVGDFAAAQQPVVMVLSEGTFLSVQAVVDNSRKYVRLTVIPFFSQIEDVDTFTFTGEESSEYEESEDIQGDINEPSDTTVQRSMGASMFSRSGTSVQLPSYAFLNVSTTVSVPDGGTILLGGVKRLSEGRNEFGVPLLSHIPYVDRLFRNVSVGRETQSLMMMVTPRIIIQEEEEERIGLSN